MFVYIVTAGRELVLRNKRTYSPFTATEPFRISGSGIAYINGFTALHMNNLAAGSNITLTQSGNTLTIASSGAVSSAVTSFNGLTGPVGIAQGSNVTITQSGSTFTIASTGTVGPTGPTGADGSINDAILGIRVFM